MQESDEPWVYLALGKSANLKILERAIVDLVMKYMSGDRLDVVTLNGSGLEAVQVRANVVKELQKMKYAFPEIYAFQVFVRREDGTFFRKPSLEEPVSIGSGKTRPEGSTVKARSNIRYLRNKRK